MASMTYGIRIRQRWWVRPYIALARFNACLGIPVDLARMALFLARHGVTYELVRKEP